MPAHTGERFIGSTVLTTRGDADRVVLVSDASPAAAAANAQTAGAVAVCHPLTLGRTAALRPGLSFAKGRVPRVVVALYADGQHLGEGVSRLTSPVLVDQAGGVIGPLHLSPVTAVPTSPRLGHGRSDPNTAAIREVAVMDSVAPRAHEPPVTPASLSIIRIQDLRLAEQATPLDCRDTPKRSPQKPWRRRARRLGCRWSVPTSPCSSAVLRDGSACRRVWPWGATR